MSTKGGPHRDLVEDLATFFFDDRIVFAEPNLEPRWFANDSGYPLPDVLTLNKSYSNPMPSIYEVKVSKQDFQRDIQSGKWSKYLAYAQRFYFACPSGMIKKEEVPQGAGLIVKGDNGWTVIKAPHVNHQYEFSLVSVQALLMSGAFTARRVRVLRDRISTSDNIDLEWKAKKIGEEIRTILRKVGDDTKSFGAEHVVDAITRLTGCTRQEVFAMDSSEIEKRLIDRSVAARYLDAIQQLASDAQASWGLRFYQSGSECESQLVESRIQEAKTTRKRKNKSL